jgi:hypothetical protein
VAAAEVPKGRRVGDLKIFQVDDHFFRIDAGRPEAPAEVYRDGRWIKVVLTTEEVLTLMNARELSAKEIQALKLPD